MNILAKEQEKVLEAGISEEEYQIRNKQFLDLYYKTRTKEEKGILGRLSLNTRKRLHPLILAIYKIKNRLGGFSFELINERSVITNQPIIFAVTHVGKFDIEVVSEAVREHYYLLSGDFEHLQGTIDAPFLNVNGVIYFNERVKADRRSSSERMISLLQQGGNLMYFPEGTWNLSPNLPVLPCYWGIIDVARSGGATIIPVAAEQYGKHFIINIGANFDVTHYGNDKKQAIEDLRDSLATLKWEIWETRPFVHRADVKPEDWKKYKKARLKEWPGFSEDYINGLIFQPKGVTAAKEVFSHLEHLIPSRENAFLLSKRNIH